MKYQRNLTLDAPTLSSRTISGYALVYNTLSEDLGGFREQFSPEAFAKQFQGKTNIRALKNHDDTLVLGTESAGTVRIRNDSKGIAYEIDIPETTYGNDLLVSIERGDITGMSFTFLMRNDGFSVAKAGDQIIRTVKEARLLEISPVTFPAYSSSFINQEEVSAMRKLAEESELKERSSTLDADTALRIVEVLKESR